jgi:hypothetical protein
LNLNVKFELNSIGKGQFGPSGLLAQQACWPSQPTWLGYTIWLGSGSNHRPSPAPYSHTSSSPRFLWRLDRRRRRLASPASSGELCRCHLGRNMRPCVLYPLHRVESPSASSTRRSGWFYSSGSTASNRLRFDASPTYPSCASCAILWCLRCTRSRRWKCRDVVLPVSAR